MKVLKISPFEKPSKAPPGSKDSPKARGIARLKQIHYKGMYEKEAIQGWLETTRSGRFENAPAVAA